jgi:hypothetical protein
VWLILVLMGLVSFLVGSSWDVYLLPLLPIWLEPKTPLTSSTPTTSLSLTLSSQLSLASATFYLFKPVYIPPEGLPLSIYVTSADVQDRVGARYLVAGLKPFVPRLTALAGCR